MQTLTASPFPPTYLTLCQTERLQHDFEEGDWVVYLGGEEPRPAAALFHQTPAGSYPESYAWVPRLDQLLELLSLEESAWDLAFDWWPEASWDALPEEHWRCSRMVPEFMAAEGRGSCREEAAYRLLLSLRARP